MMEYNFSNKLQEKIDYLNQKKTPVCLGRVNFSSKLILAPLASITDVPYRLLMQDLGSGGSVTELISCHGINYNNEKTIKMLKINEAEKNVGIQLFGENPDDMAKAAVFCEKLGPHFIDINVGCPVKKVVGKGAGAALLKDLQLLQKIILAVKKSISIPLTLKIRTGWSKNELVAQDIADMAVDEKIEFICLHGRSKDQLYSGFANWDYIEDIAKNTKIPVVGNGDLHNAQFVRMKLQTSSCGAFMLGRGPLRNPFLFLESFISDTTDHKIFFTPADHLEVINKLYSYMQKFYEKDRIIEIQLKKHALWITAGFPGASGLRKKLFTLSGHLNVHNYLVEYFQLLEDNISKHVNHDLPFLSGGHG